MNKREKVLFIAIVVLFIGLFLKSTILDEIGEVTGGEKVFKNDIYKLIDQTYTNTIIKYRLVKIEVEESDKGLIYTGKIRKYLFGIIPFSDIKIQIEYDGEGIKNES